MAKVGNTNPEEAPGRATPADATADSAAAGPKDGIHLTRPRTTIVDDYPERPYSEAVTAPHLEILKAAGQEPV